MLAVCSPFRSRSVSAQGLTSFQFDLAFNPTFIKALSFTDIGTDFATAASTGGGSLTGITGFIDNTAGVLSGVAGSMSGLITGAGLTPSGVVVNATFQALAVGISPLTLSTAFLTDNGVPLSSANGNFRLVNGQVRAVPEPSYVDPVELRARRAGDSALPPAQRRLRRCRCGFAPASGRQRRDRQDRLWVRIFAHIEGRKP